jgi:hypothetical protein
VVQTTGSKLWRFRYRYGGVPKTLHIGARPTISLPDAREKCREARKAIAAGADPVLEKKRAELVAQFSVATSFKEISIEWHAKCEREGLAEISLDKIRWLLGIAMQHWSDFLDGLRDAAKAPRSATTKSTEGKSSRSKSGRPAGRPRAKLLRPQAVIPSVHEKIVDGRLVDTAVLQFLRESIVDMIEMQPA